MNCWIVRAIAFVLALVAGAQESLSQEAAGCAPHAGKSWLFIDIFLVLCGITAAAWFIRKIFYTEEAQHSAVWQQDRCGELEAGMESLSARVSELERENVRLDLLNKKLVDEMAERENITRDVMEPDRILSMLSDEWRSSLNIVLGMSRALKESALSEEQRRHVTNIERAGAALGDSLLKLLEIGGGSSAQAGAGVRASAEASAGAASLEGTRILVVEDNPVNQLVALTVLKRAGAVVSTADNGKEALAIYGRQDFDLILMDIQMPQMDGYRATAEIRSHPDLSKRNIPIIALTASAFLTRKDKAELFGMNDHVAKPFQPEELLEKINNCLAV